LNGALAGLIVVACVVLLPIWRPIDRAIGAPTGLVGDAPPGVTAALRDLVKPGDRILNPQPWGSWFELALPANPVAIDSRIELFPAAVWDELDRVRSGGEGWQASLTRWQVRVVVTRHSDSELVSRLTMDGWRIAFDDDDATVLLAPQQGGAP
jgi:hypothetical protein